MENTIVYDVNEIKHRLEPVFAENNIKSAVLFGSYALGCATPKSDVDILIDGGLQELDVYQLINYASQILSKKVDLINIKSLSPDSAVKQEIAETGIGIFGCNQLPLRPLPKRSDYLNSKRKLLASKILEYIEKIERYTKDISCEEFLNNSEKTEACIFSIFQLSELSLRFDDELIETERDIPWHKIRGLRNLIAHEYDRFDNIVAWEIIKDDLPDLRKKLEEIKNQ